MEELVAQLEQRRQRVDWIVVATGSGGTQAGMEVGARAAGFGGKILGIAVSRPANEQRRKLAPIAGATAAHLGLR